MRFSQRGPIRELTVSIKFRCYVRVFYFLVVCMYVYMRYEYSKRM